MTKVYVNFETDSAVVHPPAPWTYNTFGSSGTAIGTLSSDLLDDTNSATGWSLEVTGAFTAATGSDSNATSGSGGWPENTFDYTYYVAAASTGQLKISGLTAGHAYTVELAGHRSSTATGRDTRFTVEGQSADYVESGSGTPSAPVVLTGTVPGTGILTIDVDDAPTGATFSYINGFTIETVASTSVTQSDTTPEDGVQQSFTTTGLTGTITAATLGGYDILSLLSDTDPTTATTYTLDISAIEASQGAPRIGQTSTLSITATGGTATTDVVIQPKTGWAEVDLAGTLNKDAGGFLALLDSTLGLTSAVGDIIYYDASSNAAITAAGVYTSDLTTAGQNTPFVIQQGGSATTVSTSEGGAFYPYGEAGGSGSKVVQSINISNLRIGL